MHGHKIWTSNAQDADFMFGLFRTEPDAVRHAGISYLLLDMRQPGIEVRPLRQMNGAEEFCEVFLDGARTPADQIVGERGEGWKVSKATLKHERLLMGDFSYLARNFRALVWLAKQATRNGRPAIEDPGVRQRLAEIEGYVLTNEYSSYRMVTAVSNNQDVKAMDAMLTAKLYVSEALRHVADLALDLLQEDGLRAPDADEVSMTFLNITKGAWVSQYMFSMAMGIAGGASNIQRNIIGEKLLGLPRDVRPV